MLYFEYHYKFRTILYSTKLWIHAQRKGAVTQSHVSDGEGQAFIGANYRSEMGVSEGDVWPEPCL